MFAISFPIATLESFTFTIILPLISETTVQENAEDIYEGAKQINEERAEAKVAAEFAAEAEEEETEETTEDSEAETTEA